MEKFLASFFSDPTGFTASYFKKITESALFGGLTGSIRAIFLFLAAFLILAIIVLFVAAFRYRPKIHPEHGTVKKIFTLKDATIKDRWGKVMSIAAAGTPEALKLAIIDVDKLVDDILRQLGFEGEHMADRLEKISPSDVLSLNKLWDAHRVRNDLVHTPGYEISLIDGKRTIAHYEAFLKEIKVLE